MRMERYECSGWLRITTSEDSPVLKITIKHEMSHEAYKDIGLPDEWKRYIEVNAATQTPGQARSVSLVAEHVNLTPWHLHNALYIIYWYNPLYIALHECV